MGKEKVRVDKDGQVLNVLTEEGYEIPDPVPMAPPVGFVRREPLHERIRAMVQHEFQRTRAMSEVETPEEADDFVIPGEEGDDAREPRFALMPGFEWEENYDPPADFGEMHRRLVDLGWTPPAKPGRTPLVGGAQAGPEGDRAPAAASSAADPGGAGPRPDDKGS